MYFVVGKGHDIDAVAVVMVLRTRVVGKGVDECMMQGGRDALQQSVRAYYIEQMVGGLRGEAAASVGMAVGVG